MIYQTEKESCIGVCGEYSRPDYDKRFLEAVCDKVVDVLQIKCSERQIVSRLLYSALEREVIRNGKESFLIQYIHSQLDIILKRFEQEFDIKSETNYAHAMHGKFSDLIQVIKDKYEG